MDVQRIAAFSQETNGGNPAGVVLCDVLPPADRMLAIAAEVGYSETVFAAPSEDGWRVRYLHLRSRCRSAATQQSRSGQRLLLPMATAPSRSNSTTRGSR